MRKPIETAEKKETAVLVGLINKHQSDEKVKEYLDELEFLALTAGAEVKKKFIQRLETPDPKTFIGKGKAEEIQAYIKEHEIDAIIFDDELSPSQLRNINQMMGCKILDRNNLILDIFANRARTAHAKAQVELAQYEYLLPRLTRMWTHLERQRGGIGLRGPGETEIETDRRIIRDKISRLKAKLETISKQKETQRGSRGQLVRVALVGYTNVGKSTLMNLLSKSEVFAENKLFATLDTTVRKMVIGNLPFLLSDTVGFIRKLPHQLVESFKSTLDEVREADVLMHVVDISHPNFEDHIEVVNNTLQEIGATGKKVIMVFNKIDLYQFKEREEEFDHTGHQRETHTIEDLKKTWMGRANGPVLFISATEKKNIDELREVLYEQVKTIHQVRYPHKFLY